MTGADAVESARSNHNRRSIRPAYPMGHGVAVGLGSMLIWNAASRCIQNLAPRHDAPVSYALWPPRDLAQCIYYRSTWRSTQSCRSQLKEAFRRLRGRLNACWLWKTASANPSSNKSSAIMCQSRMPRKIPEIQAMDVRVDWLDTARHLLAYRLVELGYSVKACTLPR